jgi:hypothetical protein
VSDAARGSADIAENILGVAGAARQTTEVAAAASATALDVEAVADDLHRLISHRKIVRQAFEVNEAPTAGDKVLVGAAAGAVTAEAPAHRFLPTAPGSGKHPDVDHDQDTRIS